MNKFENLGFKAIVTQEKLNIEISIDNLINGFNRNPENYANETIKQDKKQEFAEYVAKNLIDGTDIGDSIIMQATDRVFEQILEGYEEFVEYREDEEDE